MKETPRRIPPRLGPDVLALAFLALCALALHRDALLSGSVFFEDDTAAFYYPLTEWFAGQLHQGRIPLWLPNIFSGYALFADGEVGMLYPPGLVLLALLPVPAAFVAGRILHSFLAAAGLYVLLRVLRVGPLGATVGGLVFAFGSFFVAQMHHENVVRTAVWLPLALVPLELAFRARDWRWHAGLILSGVVLAVAMLGVHVQPAIMALIAVAGYALFRTIFPPSSSDPRSDQPGREPIARALRLLWALALVPGTALLLAGAQWVPLFELGRASFRGRGVAYEFATAFAVHPANLLPGLLFPYFFRGPDGVWWTLWSQWETAVYVGVAPLLLGAVGLALSGRRLALYFAAIALFGLLVALASDAPLNLHRLLWSLPGLSSLRAPGRFSYLFVFGLAGLAGLGADRLLQPLAGRGRAVVGLIAALAGLGAAALALELARLRAWLLAEPAAALTWIESTYLTLRRATEEPTPAVVYRGLVFSLDLANPKTAFSLALLALGSLALVGLALGRGPRRAWVGLLLGLVAADLLVFAADFHPRRPLADLARPAPALRFLSERDPGARVFVDPRLADLRPDRPVRVGLRDLGGYSSLQPQRHFDYFGQVDRQDDALLDLWGARYVVLPASPAPVRARGVAFDPDHPLAGGPAGNPTSFAALAAPGQPARAVRLIGTLSHAVTIPQGAVVAELAVEDAAGQRLALPLRAGEHLAEQAHDRPDVAPAVRHARPPVAHALADWTPDGQRYAALLYLAELPLDPPRAVTRVEFRYLYPEGEGLLYGLALVGEDGSVRSLSRRDRAKYRPIYDDGQVVVLENQAAFPRAFVLPAAVRQADRPREAALPQMTLRPFDPARVVILEGRPPGPLAADPAWKGDVGPPQPAEVRELSPEELLVRAEAPPEGGWLVLADAYHRGWRAYLDGHEESVWIADYLFRAVRLPAGPHEVRFVFDPLSHRIGRYASVAGLLFVVAALLLLPRVGRLRR